MTLFALDLGWAAVWVALIIVCAPLLILAGIGIMAGIVFIGALVWFTIEDWYKKYGKWRRKRNENR